VRAVGGVVVFERLKSDLAAGLLEHRCGRYINVGTRDLRACGLPEGEDVHRAGHPSHHPFQKKRVRCGDCGVCVGFGEIDGKPYYDHDVLCPRSNASIGDMRERVKKERDWQREQNARHAQTQAALRNQIAALQGKLAILRHENNKLRRKLQGRMENATTKATEQT
jgi:hypothetical protein